MTDRITDTQLAYLNENNRIVTMYMDSLSRGFSDNCWVLNVIRIEQHPTFVWVSIAAICETPAGETPRELYRQKQKWQPILEFVKININSHPRA